MKNNKIYSFLITLFTISYVFADIPPIPDDPNTGGGGVTGTGSAASPIDMYVYFLLIAALILIIQYSRKYYKKIA